jgi:hypothetical protein
MNETETESANQNPRHSARPLTKPRCHSDLPSIDVRTRIQEHKQRDDKDDAHPIGGTTKRLPETAGKWVRQAWNPRHATLATHTTELHTKRLVGKLARRGRRWRGETHTPESGAMLGCDAPVRHVTPFLLFGHHNAKVLQTYFQLQARIPAESDDSRKLPLYHHKYG